MAAGHNALRESGSRSLARSQELPWHDWGVPISGSTGWVHYPRTALSNLVSARKARISPTTCEAGSAADHQGPGNAGDLVGQGGPNPA